MIGEISGRGNLWETSAQRTAWSEKCRLGSVTWGIVSRGIVPQSINSNNAFIINEYVSIIALLCKGCFWKGISHWSFCRTL